MLAKQAVGSPWASRAAEAVAQHSCEDRARRAEQPANERLVDEAERAHHGRCRDRQDEVGDQEPESHRPGPTAVAAQPTGRCLSRERPLQLAAPDREGNQDQQRETNKDGEQARHWPLPGATGIAQRGSPADERLLLGRPLVNRKAHLAADPGCKSTRSYWRPAHSEAGLPSGRWSVSAHRSPLDTLPVPPGSLGATGTTLPEDESPHVESGRTLGCGFRHHYAHTRAIVSDHGRGPLSP
jgi:hypothetical protein